MCSRLPTHGFEETDVSAFIIGRLQIDNRDWMEEYFSKAPPLVESYGGVFLVGGGNPVKLEGDDKFPVEAFVVEFPSREQALAFWHSEAYAPLIKLRQTGSRLNAIVVDRKTKSNLTEE